MKVIARKKSSLPLPFFEEEYFLTSFNERKKERISHLSASLSQNWELHFVILNLIVPLLVANTQLYKKLCPSVHEASGKTSNFFLGMCVVGGRGAWGVERG